MASNDINESVLHSLAEQDHSIDSFGKQRCYGLWLGLEESGCYI